MTGNVNREENIEVLNSARSYRFRSSRGTWKERERGGGRVIW